MKFTVAAANRGNRISARFAAQAAIICIVEEQLILQVLERTFLLVPSFGPPPLPDPPPPAPRQVDWLRADVIHASYCLERLRQLEGYSFCTPGPPVAGIDCTPGPPSVTCSLAPVAGEEELVLVQVNYSYSLRVRYRDAGGNVGEMLLDSGLLHAAAVLAGFPGATCGAIVRLDCLSCRIEPLDPTASWQHVLSPQVARTFHHRPTKSWVNILP